MNEFAIFDTSVFLDQARTNRHAARIDGLGLPIRNSSVVLAELWRGATTVQEREFVFRLEEDHAILTPNADDWRDSGHILAAIRVNLGIQSAKLRDLHFDVLIALTVRSNGARLFTSNRDDFELIREYRDFKLEVW